MFDLLQAPEAPHAIVSARPAPSEPAALTHCLALMLDEIDYGMLLLADEQTVVHANHLARSELDATHPLQLLGHQLRVRRSADLAPLRSALSDAVQRGLRRMVLLGDGNERITVAVVPLAGSADRGQGQEAHTLLVFGKRHMCPALSALWFARSHGLTPAESRVLVGLCEGQAPGAVAAAQHVALSTVRTQIGSIRAKTGAASIRALVRQVAVLPPLVSALRGVALH